MKSRKTLLRKSRLYLILDGQALNKRFFKKIYPALSDGKINIVQLRDKESTKEQVLEFALNALKYLKADTLFIINDYIDLALADFFDGVHLGQEDMPLKQAREILGKNKIIGISCHSLAQALKAQRAGADYIGIGPVFATATKPDYKPIGLKTLRSLAGKIKIPYFAIGDIQKGNLKDISACGAKRIAVCRAILRSSDPKLAARQLILS